MFCGEDDEVDVDEDLLGLELWGEEVVVVVVEVEDWFWLEEALRLGAIVWLLVGLERALGRWW